MMTNKAENQELAPTGISASDVLPPVVTQAIQAFQSGQVKNVQLSLDNGKMKISADASDGSARYIFQQESFFGITETTNASISKPISKEERLNRVEQLHNQGKTQDEIKQYTMTSQKTVSNDIQELRKMGRIK